MKIVRLSPFLDFGGIESKMSNLSQYSDENEWLFCAIGKGGKAEQSILSNHKKAICFHLSHRILSLKTIIKLFLYFKKNKPNVVHCSGAEANFHGVIAAKLAKVPLIVAEEIGISNQTKKAKFVFNFIYQLADFVLGESQIVIENLKKNYNIDSQKLKIVSNFTLFPKLENYIQNKINPVFRLLSVSRLENVKNIEGIVKVISLLKNENFNINYTIVGDGSSKSKIKTLISQLDLTNEIEMVGYQNNTISFYSNSDLFIINSLSEGFSNALLEAMYFKNIVISTKVGNATEMIQNDKNGFLIDVDNENHLFQTIKKIISLDENVVENIKNQAHKTVFENFSIQNHVDKLMQIYTSKK